MCRWYLLLSVPMKTLELSDVLAAMHTTTTDSLADQVGQITQSALEHGLRILPGRVDANSLVQLDSEAMAIDEVVAAADL